MGKKTEEFLRKTQNLPLSQRKVIFWLLIIIIGIFLFFVFFYITAYRLANFQPRPPSKRASPVFKMMEMPSFEMEIPEMYFEEEQELNDKR
jgi:hypothetical protein